MHNFQLTSLVVAALSTVVKGNPVSPVVNPGGPMVGTAIVSTSLTLPTISLIPTLSLLPSGVIPTGFPTGVQSGFSQPTFTSLPGASFTITGGKTGSKCEIELSNVGQCASGKAVMSETTSCMDMKKKHTDEELHLLPSVKCITKTGGSMVAKVNWHEKDGKMDFWYEDGVSNFALDTKKKPIRPDSKKTRYVTEGQICICSTELASDGKCSDVKCEKTSIFPLHTADESPDKN